MSICSYKCRIYTMDFIQDLQSNHNSCTGQYKRRIGSYYIYIYKAEKLYSFTVVGFFIFTLYLLLYQYNLSHSWRQEYKFVQKIHLCISNLEINFTVRNRLFSEIVGKSTVLNARKLFILCTQVIISNILIQVLTDTREQ